jgi:hypothetical protein
MLCYKVSFLIIISYHPDPAMTSQPMRLCPHGDPLRRPLQSEANFSPIFYQYKNTNYVIEKKKLSVSDVTNVFIPFSSNSKV